jgi:hypothetical protein
LECWIHSSHQSCPHDTIYALIIHLLQVWKSANFYISITSSVQNLASSIVSGNTGFLALCTIYISFCTSSLFIATFFIAQFKAKISLIFGALCYLTFIMANRWPSRGSLLPTAAMLGVGAGVLWGAQGTYLTQASCNYSKARSMARTANMGLFNGIFFAIFQVIWLHVQI